MKFMCRLGQTALCIGTNMKYIPRMPLLIIYPILAFCNVALLRQKGLWGSLELPFGKKAVWSRM